MNITDMSGRSVYSTIVPVRAGQNHLKLEGGSEGQYLVVLKIEMEKHCFRYNLSSGSGKGFSMTPDAGSISKFWKDDPESLDSLYIVYSKAGYNTFDTTVVPATQTIDVTFPPDAPVLLIHDYYLKAADVNGNVPDDYILGVKWKDDTITYHPVENGYIHIYREEFSANNTDTMIFIPDLANHLIWTIGRKMQHPLDSGNLYQNFADFNTPPQYAEVDVNKMPDTSRFFVIPKEVQNPQTSGMIRMDNDSVLYIMTARNGGRTTHFIQVPNWPGGLNVWVYDGNLNTPTELGKTMFRTIYLLDIGTVYRK